MSDETRKSGLIGIARHIIDQGYSLQLCIEDCIPILQHAIKDAVTTEVKEWLFR